MGERPCVRCPKCGNQDNLALTEVHEEYGTTQPGRIEIDHIGSLVPPTEFDFSPGDPVLVLITCRSCHHQWRPRSQSVSSELPPEEPA